MGIQEHQKEVEKKITSDSTHENRQTQNPHIIGFKILQDK